MGKVLISSFFSSFPSIFFFFYEEVKIAPGSFCDFCIPPFYFFHFFLYSFLSSHVPTDGQVNNFPPFIQTFTESYFVQRTVQYSEFLELLFSGVLFNF